jgi:hypothetical protein
MQPPGPIAAGPSSSQGAFSVAVVVDAMAGGRADPAAAEPAPLELVGIHTNMAGAVAPDLYTAAFIGTRRRPVCPTRS